MATTPPFELAPRRCKTCGLDLGLGALVCPQCHALVYSEELTILSLRANQLESDGDIAGALSEWRRSLPMLPAHVNQAEWVREHIRKLDLAAVAAPPPQKNAWARKLGPLAPIAVFLAKAKWLLTLFKFKFLFSLGAFFALYWTLWGWKFGLGFAICILIHEMGHYIDIRRRGLPADMPVFLPGFGAYVRWQAMGISLETRAAVSLAGPFAGALAAYFCLLAFQRTGDTFWAGLARAGAWLNLMNLIPIWVLDGGGAIRALDSLGRWSVIIAALLLALLFQEGVFLLIAGGAIWRLFTKDLPPLPSLRISAYYIALLLSLGAILRYVPGEIFPR